MRKGEKLYKRINIKGRTVLLHRYVMECHLRRSISPDEIVHHINGNTRDNRIENLMVLTPSEHSRIEHLGKKQSEQTKQKRSEKLRGNKNALGTVRSKEAIEASAKKNKGHKRSAETKDKLRVAALGNKHMLGKKHSEETLAKMRESNKKAWVLRKLRASLKKQQSSDAH